MKLCTVKETAERWNVSERLVRRLYTEGRIPEAVHENGVLMIPVSATKPKNASKPKWKSAA